ncbi:MAG: creatininase family protein, partial [Bacteroidales bacterium]|nr:creatininase family protein [Bacteroidales bacterium]
MTIDIDFLSWSEARTTVYDLAVLPWGATEPHNYHLPYTTDNLLSRSVSLEAAKKASEQGVNSMVFPAIPFGSQNPGQ